MTLQTSDNEIKLIEEDRKKIFRNGELVKLGNYWIGWDLVFGIHIPVTNKEEGELIMKQILQDKERVKKLESKFQLLLKYTGRDVVSAIRHIIDLEEENQQLKEKLKESQ